MVVIRSASAADAAQIAAVMRASWRTAYEGIIAAEIIGRVTADDGGARVRQSFRTRPWQKTLVAVADGPEAPAGIVGYALFGPEQDVLGAPWPHPLSAAGEQGRVAELYALYVHPAWWSTGTGRALMDRVLAAVSAAGYPSVRLWVLRDNSRARRFYERAGFAPDGASHTLEGLGGVTEIRYRRPLAPGTLGGTATTARSAKLAPSGLHEAVWVSALALPGAVALAAALLRPPRPWALGSPSPRRGSAASPRRRRSGRRAPPYARSWP